MPLSRLDFEKIDPSLFAVLSAVSNLESLVSSQFAPYMDETKQLILVLDDYRNALALYIEEIARRS